ncbi:hypothetical protein GCM10023238_02360 [Streptomyces heliomycini]
MLIVDEAHTCVGTGGNEQQKRYELLSALADRTERDRHLILVTATPHSGDPQAFAKLTGLLDPSLRTLDTTRSADRDKLARHFVQRPPPRHQAVPRPGHALPEDRDTQDALYRLDADYARFVADILAHTRQQVRGPGGDHHQRMSWWTALTLLRCVLSSPAAAAATLRARSLIAATRTPAEADKLGRAAAFELATTRPPRAWTWCPAPSRPSRTRRCHPADTPRGTHGEAEALTDFADRADALAGPATDAKLRTLVDGSSGNWSTATTRSSSATTSRPPSTWPGTSRRSWAAARAWRRSPAPCTRRPAGPRRRADRRRGRHVLVATDCLSEGVNLQEHFGAVIHYDLSWNPHPPPPASGPRRPVRPAPPPRPRDHRLRHRHRHRRTRPEGPHPEAQGHRRPDRCGRPRPRPGPGRPGSPRQRPAAAGGQPEGQLTLDFEDDPDFGRAREALHKEWESAAERESKVLTKFAHIGLRPEEVEAELDALRQALGDPATSPPSPASPGPAGRPADRRRPRPGLQGPRGPAATGSSTPSASTRTPTRPPRPAERPRRRPRAAPGRPPRPRLPRGLPRGAR